MVKFILKKNILKIALILIIIIISCGYYFMLNNTMNKDNFTNPTPIPTLSLTSVLNVWNQDFLITQNNFIKYSQLSQLDTILKNNAKSTWNSLNSTVRTSLTDKFHNWAYINNKNSTPVTIASVISDFILYYNTCESVYNSVNSDKIIGDKSRSLQTPLTNDEIIFLNKLITIPSLLAE